MTKPVKYINHKYLLRVIFAISFLPFSLFAKDEPVLKNGYTVQISKEKSNEYDISDAMQYFPCGKGRIFI